MIDSHSLTINRGKLGQQIDIYNQAISELDEAYQKLDEIQASLRAGCITDHYRASYSVLPNGSYSDPTYHLASIKRRLKMQFWNYIFDLLEIKKFLSSGRLKELEERLENPDELPEISFQTVFAEIDGIMQSATDLKNELVREAFGLLRPRHCYRQHYKTNKQFRVGPKVILTSKVEPHYDKFRVTQTHTVGTIDRAFHVMDGQTILNGYQSELVDTINDAEAGEGSTKYFKFKAHKNGNLHLTFLRPDLVRQLNIIGSDDFSMGTGED